MRTVCTLFLVSLLSACMSTRPKNDLGFSEVKKISNLDGCYLNLAETGKNVGKKYLSSIVFPNSKLVHDTVEAIDVKSAGRSFIVKAIAQEKVIHQGEFLEGRDFIFSNGTLTITKAFGSGLSEPGSVFLGVGIQSTTLGVDASGDGRVVEDLKIAGTAFLIIPVAASGTDVVRYVKAPNRCGLS